MIFFRLKAAVNEEVLGGFSLFLITGKNIQLSTVYCEKAFRNGELSSCTLPTNSRVQEIQTA